VGLALSGKGGVEEKTMAKYENYTVGGEKRGNSGGGGSNKGAGRVRGGR